jgi:hypothetical protein
MVCASSSLNGSQEVVSVLRPPYFFVSKRRSIFVVTGPSAQAASCPLQACPCDFAFEGIRDLYELMAKLDGMFFNKPVEAPDLG